MPSTSRQLNCNMPDQLRQHKRKIETKFAEEVPGSVKAETWFGQHELETLTGIQITQSRKDGAE